MGNKPHAPGRLNAAAIAVACYARAWNEVKLENRSTAIVAALIAFRFVARLPPAENAECVLLRPAGSLSCRRTDSTHPGQFLGLCLLEP
jgi:hypothetical protein